MSSRDQRLEKSGITDPSAQHGNTIRDPRFWGDGVERALVRTETETGQELIRLWDSLRGVQPDSRVMRDNGLFREAASHPATIHFDMLRTKVMQALRDNNWKRIAVTSATHGCGKSLVAANLALAIARADSTRCVLVDLELRQPGLAELFGLRAGPLQEVLNGNLTPGEHVTRLGDNLALALNSYPIEHAAETLQSPRTAASLKAIIEQLDPGVMVIDLPPALGSDDVMAVLPQIDAVLLVADGDKTTAADIRACEKLFEGRVPLLGVVLNRGKDTVSKRYRYGK